jgi:uncharacterized protein
MMAFDPLYSHTIDEFANRDNLVPREFHLFRREDSVYLFDIDTMDARRLSAEETDAVLTLLTSFGSPMNNATLDTLRRIGAIEANGISGGPSQSGVEGSSPAVDENEVPVIQSKSQGVTGIALFVAQSCNLGCVYCYGLGGAYGEKAGLMKHDTAHASVDWLIENCGDVPSVNISFFGGEPLLNLALVKDVVAYAKERAAEHSKRVTFGMTTNGTLLDDEAIAFLASEHVNVMVSFDGTESLQNANRPFKDGRASFDIVRSNVEKFRAVSPKIRGRATVTGEADYTEIEATMKAIGFSSAVIVDASPVILDTENVSKSGISDKTKQTRETLFSEAAERFVAAVKDRRFEDGPVNSMFRTLLKKSKRFYGCSLGKETVAVSQGGDIYPCHRFVGQQDEILGNVKDSVINLTDWFYKSNVLEMPDCKNCWARHLCGGGCFYENKAHTGDKLHPDRDYCAGVRDKAETIISAYCELDEADKMFLRTASKSA